MMDLGQNTIYRRTFVQREKKEWEEIDFRALKKGQRFKLKDGESWVEDEGGSTEWVAATDASLDVTGVYYVEIEKNR